VNDDFRESTSETTYELALQIFVSNLLGDERDANSEFRWCQVVAWVMG